jgi:hypothetical protein
MLAIDGWLLHVAKQADGSLLLNFQHESCGAAAASSSRDRPNEVRSPSPLQLAKLCVLFFAASGCSQGALGLFLFCVFVSLRCGFVKMKIWICLGLLC